MAVAVDASTPARWSAVLANGGSVDSASFVAPANALLVACVNHDGDTTGGLFGTMTFSDSGSLAWTERVRRAETETTDGGASIIYTARTTSSVARTARMARSAGGGPNIRCSCKLYVLTGVDVDGTPVDSVGANNEGGSATNNLVTSSITPGANGLIFACDTDWNALGAFEASSDLTQDTAHYAGNISVNSGYHTVSSGFAATANLNAAGTAAAQHKWCQVIVREAPPTGFRRLPLIVRQREAPSDPVFAE